MADLLSIGSSGINVYQRALSTVSNNIANLNTEGYSRQTTEIDQAAPQQAGKGFIGTGAFFERVARQYDSFLEQSLQRATSDLESQKSNAEYTARLLDFLGDDEIGLVSSFNKFFSAAQALTTDPASSAYRSTMLRSSQELATRVNSLGDQLDDLGSQAFSAMEAEIRSLNGLAEQVAKVNSQLLKKKSALDQPPALLDQRDQMVRDLSEYAGITTTINSQGLVSVSVAGSSNKGLLVDGLEAKTLSVSRNAIDPETVQFALNGGEDGIEPLTGISSGSLAGLNQFMDSSLRQAKVALNDLIGTFAGEANAIQEAGLDLNGHSGDPLFEFIPRVSVDQSSVSGTLQVSTRAVGAPVPDINELAVTWNEQEGAWQAVDPGTGEIVLSDANQRLEVANLEIQVSGQASLGDRILISARNSNVLGLQVALDKGEQLAAASLFRVTPAETNRGGSIDRVNFDASTASSGFAEIVDEASISPSSTAPVAVIPPGQSEAVVEFELSDASIGGLQLLTRDGRHLIGQSDATDFDALIESSDFFASDSTYSSNYLNQTDPQASDYDPYKDFSFEYGAIADSSAVTKLTPLRGFSFSEPSGVDFDGGALEFTLHAPNTNGTLDLKTVDTAVVTAGQVSVVGQTVYLGNGTDAEVLGSISYPYDATSSGPFRLRIDLQDTQFENASFEDDALGATAITGWTTLNERIELGSTTIEGVISPLDSSYPANNTNNDTDPMDTTGSYSVVVDSRSDGQGQALRLTSSGQTSTTGYAVSRGPAVVSDATVEVAAGDTISFDWQALGGGDAFDAFGYFINEDTNETHIVLNETGASASEETAWATVDFTVPDDGNYRFVFVSGSFDASGGKAMGGQLYVDNITVQRQEPQISATVLDQIAQQLVMTDQRSLADGAEPLTGLLAIDAYDADGVPQLQAEQAIQSETLIASGNTDSVSEMDVATLRADRIDFLDASGDIIAADSVALNGQSLGALTKGLSVEEGFGALSALDVAAWINAANDSDVSVITSNEIRIDPSQLALTGPGLSINDTSITSLANSSTTSFASAADLVNSINAAAIAVEAVIETTGDIVLRNRDGLGANIKLGAVTASSTNALGRANTVIAGQFQIQQSTESAETLTLGLIGEGEPKDLSQIGLTTTVRIRGALDEEIGLFMTGGVTDQAALTSRLQSVDDTFSEGLRDRVFDVTVTDAGRLTIVDRATGTEVANRPYQNETSITYQGITLTLREPALAGDQFVIDGNNTGPGQAFDAQGNNQNWLRMVDLEQSELVDGLTTLDAYLGIVGDTGNQATQAEISVEALGILRDQAIEARDRVSGVSLDREAADLIRFQQAYQASAQVMQVATRLFDAILQVR